MKTPLSLTVYILMLFVSCDTSTKKKQDQETVSGVDTLKLDSSKKIDLPEETEETIP